MTFEVYKSGEMIHISDQSGSVFADLCLWTSSQAQNVLDRELGPGEEFYWINHLFNRSGEQGKGTELLRYMISVLRAEKITAGLIASPLAPYPQENFCLPVFEKRLHSWYVRHGFRQAKKLPSVLIYDANVPQQGIEMLL